MTIKLKLWKHFVFHLSINITIIAGMNHPESGAIQENSESWTYYPKVSELLFVSEDIIEYTH